jgi:phage-related protein
MAELDLNVNVKTKGARKLDSLGGVLAGVGKAAVFGAAAGVTALGAIGVAATAAASDAEKSQAKLKSVFDGTGAAAFTSIEALNKHATALAEATTFDDDAVAEAQAVLLGFGNIVGDEFSGATDAAADLAAFMGTDIPSAAKALGKVLAAPEAGLGRLSRVIGPLTEEQEKLIQSMVDAGDVAGAQGAILDIVSGKIGTTAEELAATSSGQMAQALNALGEAGESLGVILLPVFTLFAQGLKQLADFIVAAMPTIQAAIAPVISFITGLFSGASGQVSGLQQIFAGIVAWVTANMPTISSVFGQVFGAIGNVIRVVAPVLIEVAKVLLPAIGIAASVLFKALDIAFKGIGGAFEVLGNVFETTAGFISDIVGGVIGIFKGLYNAFASFWNSIDITFPQIDVPFFGTIGGFSIGLPDIPMLAKGGIVTKPTLALIGESGPEAVVPLRGSQSAGVTNFFTYNVQSPIPDEKGLVALVNRSQRLQGMLP